ncbi:MAG: hypothetical protein E3K32_14100 [wastewater metagenome]|nr:hypothetical protein [Candidatus Loosdrechtia aerotolerans]
MKGYTFMKQILVSICLVLSFLGCASANKRAENTSESSKYQLAMEPNNLTQNKSFLEGYKGAKWGMSKQEVKECFPAETFHWRKDEDLLWFSNTIAGESADIIFVFTDDKLYQVLERIKVGEIGSQAYVFKFYKFEELLIKRYGDPSRRIRNGSLDPNVSDADAILMGRGIYSDVWHTSESRINLSLQGDNLELHLWVEYECIDLAEQKSNYSGSFTKIA